MLQRTISPVDSTTALTTGSALDHHMLFQVIAAPARPFAKQSGVSLRLGVGILSIGHGRGARCPGSGVCHTASRVQKQKRPRQRGGRVWRVAGLEVGHGAQEAEGVARQLADKRLPAFLQ